MASTEIKFRRDTSFRKTLFSPDSFAHPAKMDAQLLLWVVERYTKAGDTILDPMAGSGTAMLGCTVGRNIIQVELEGKFVDMQMANWERVKMMPQLGHEMGECQIIHGDTRNLENIFWWWQFFSGGRLSFANHAIFSPPYSNEHASGLSEKTIQEAERIHGRRYTRRSFTGGEDYGLGKDNISNLPYGDIDSIVTSPPYAEAQEGAGIAKRGYQGSKHSPTDLVGRRSYMPNVHGESEGQIGNLPYGSVDSVITSPPYEGINTTGKADSYKGAHGPHSQVQIPDYRENPSNIGNLKGDTYLSAMLQVYQQCRKVLKPGGLMIVVTKNFIRNKQEVRLDEDTIRLCEQAGFKFVERHYRKLPAQSFWRVIYQQKYPDAPVLDKEDILVFQS